MPYFSISMGIYLIPQKFKFFNLTALKITYNKFYLNQRGNDIINLYPLWSLSIPPLNSNYI